MLPMQIWVDIVESSQGYEGVSSIRDIVACRDLGNISQAVIQLVGKGVIEEYIEDKISCQEK